MKDSATMTPQKRERYAAWLRGTGVENPSDHLINQTQQRALVQIDKSKEQNRRRNLKLVAFFLGSLLVAVYVWLKL